MAALIVCLIVGAYFGFVTGVVVGSHKLTPHEPEVESDPHRGPIGGGLSDW